MTDAFLTRVAPAEGGGAYTDWGAFSLDQLWDMVSREDGNATFAQVDAWRRMARLCRDQADALEGAVNQLIQRWPDRPGTASEAFAVQVRRLIQSMREAAQAASGNGEPLSNISLALTSARVEIRALLDARGQYAVVEQQLTPQRTPSPGEAPVPPAPPGLKPPPANWRATLDQQARTIMAQTDAKVGTEANKIQSPPDYVIFASVGERTPLDGGTPGTSGSRNGHGADAFSASGTPRPTLDPSPGPTLAGPGAFGIESGLQTDGAGPVLSGSAVPDIPTGTNSPVGLGGPGSPPSGTDIGPFVTTPYGTVLAPGGVISPRGSGGQGSNRVPGPTGTGTQAGDGPTSRPAPQGVMPMAPMIPPVGGRPGSGSQGGFVPGGRPGQRRRSTVDPDDPWAVAEGGPAVLEPAPEPTEFDPGPGVIGLDR